MRDPLHRDAPDPRPVILFVIHDLRVGGAERVLVSYVNNLRRIRPIVVTLRLRGELLAELDPSVSVFDLESATMREAGAARVAGDGAIGGATTGRSNAPAGSQAWSDDLRSFVRKTMRLRALVNRSGAVGVSTFLHKSHVLGLALGITRGARVPVIANVHEAARYLEFHHTPRDRFLYRRFARHGFPRMDLVVAVAEGVRRDLVEEFGVPAQKILVLNNPLDLDAIRRLALEPVELPAFAGADGPLIVAVGRLVRIKAFDVLLRAFAQLRVTLRARLVIVGDGEERTVLENLVRALALEGRVALVGQQDNPWKYMGRADVVVSSSRTEAFPTVLGEALALGRPVVATDCAPGISEYLEGGRSGVLVPPENPSALAAAIDRVLSDHALRERLASAGPRRVAGFALAAAVERYEAALLQAVGMAADEARGGLS